MVDVELCLLLVSKRRHPYAEAKGCTLVDTVGDCNNFAARLLHDCFDYGESKADPFTVLLGSSFKFAEAIEQLV